MKTSIQTVHVENNEIIFFFDASNLPVIEIKGILYHSLEKIFQKIPQLFSTNYLEKAVKIINFLSKGIEFQVIDNIEAFKEDYKERLDVSQLELLKDMEDYICDYGLFDISSMHQPQLTGGSLVFYTKHDYSGVPYKVSLVFPIIGEIPEINYELLPCK